VAAKADIHLLRLETVGLAAGRQGHLLVAVQGEQVQVGKAQTGVRLAQQAVVAVVAHQQ
jgi:hypothetical protein